MEKVRGSSPLLPTIRDSLEPFVLDKGFERSQRAETEGNYFFGFFIQKLLKKMIRKEKGKMKKIASCLAVLLVGMSIFSGCGAGYHAVEIDSGLAFQENFLEENRTCGALYPNENFNPADDESEEYIWDTTSPIDRTFVIRNEEELKEIFSDFPAVDFEKEMVLLYIYTSPYGRTRKIKSIDVRENDLTIKFQYNKGKFGHADLSSPQQRVFIIKMDRLDVTNVKFELLSR